MPMKMMYPVLLDKDTKCPSCNTPISPVGTGIYACHTGHILEPVILITMRPKQKPEPIKVAEDKPLVPDQVNEKKSRFEDKGKLQ